MPGVAKELISSLIHELKTLAGTETIIGKEIQAGEYTLIPVAKVSLGIGAGGGKETGDKKAGQGGGGGGGISITPIAFIAVKGGEISFHVIRKGGFLDMLLEELPEIKEKIIPKKEEEEKESKD